jgi:hypothetical protein
MAAVADKVAVCRGEGLNIRARIVHGKFKQQAKNAENLARDLFSKRDGEYVWA